MVNARSSREQVVQEIRDSGGKAVGCLVDVTSESDVERLIGCAVEAFGSLDILINNAAVRREAKLQTVSLEDWKEILGIILDDAFLCARAATPHLIKSSAGAIVNIGGMTGSSGGSDRVHVVTVKAGLMVLTKARAWDLADFGVTANLVSLGMAETLRNTSTVAAKPKHQAIHKPLPGRRGTVEEIAGVVQMLCGQDGRFMTGQTVHVNGGTYLN